MRIAILIGAVTMRAVIFCVPNFITPRTSQLINVIAGFVSLAAAIATAIANSSTATATGISIVVFGGAVSPPTTRQQAFKRKQCPLPG